MRRRTNPRALSKALTWGAVAVAILAAGLVGWQGYKSYRQYSLRQSVVPQIQAAEARLREALAATLEPSPAQAAQAARAAAKLEATAREIEAHLAELRALDAGSEPAQVASAEEALDNAAAILRGQASVIRTGLAFAQARYALKAHMRGAQTRRSTWVSQAIVLKGKMEKAYFDYKFALDRLKGRLVDVRDKALAAQLRANIDAALAHADKSRAEASRL
jgi:hypothetical protein